jgi:hypothetical protein
VLLHTETKQSIVSVPPMWHTLETVPILCSGRFYLKCFRYYSVRDLSPCAYSVSVPYGVVLFGTGIYLLSLYFRTEFSSFLYAILG